MYHYIAALWDVENGDASNTGALLAKRIRHCEPEWQCLLDAPGMLVFSKAPKNSDIRVYPLSNQSGIVLGRLFSPDGKQVSLDEVGGMDRDAIERAISNRGEAFVQRYWGCFVGILRKPKPFRCLIVRDCSGKVPCYHTRLAGVDVAFSDISDVLRLGFGRFSINWTYLAAFIYEPNMQIRSCGFNEVRELLAGDCLLLGENQIEQQVAWDPRRVCEARGIESYASAVTELRAATQLSIDAWAGVYHRVLLYLSGGFDSAVVLGCLSQSVAKPELFCVNQYTENARDDERRYARLAAQRAGAHLFEKRRNTHAGAFDGQIFSGPVTAKPTVAGMFSVLEGSGCDDLARDLKVDAAWSGQGGDHLFYEMSTPPLSAADYMSRHGIGVGLMRAIGSAARLSREPYIHVFRLAWELGRSDREWRPADELTRQPCFVTRSALPDDFREYSATPWATAASHLPKGKQYQIRLLADVLNRHRPRAENDLVGEHHPLLSQPLMEICLQVPTYVLLRHGRSRALARDAFSDRVPKEIINRNDKGDTTAHVVDTIRRSEAFVKDILLDGILSRERIIDVHSLTPFLVDRQPLRLEHCWPLLACMASEIWLRTWTRSASQADFGDSTDRSTALPWEKAATSERSAVS